MFDANKNKQRCSINEFNSIIRSQLDSSVWINKEPIGLNIGAKIYLYEIKSKAHLVFNEYTENGTHTLHYVTDLNDNYLDGYLKYIKSTSQHCAAISRAVKLPKLIKDKSEAKVQASGILWSNHKYQMTKYKHYEYDMHLAWLTTFMTCPLPDTSKPMRTNDIVKAGEIGFLKDGYNNIEGRNWGDSVTFEGEYADYIFPITKAPNLAYFERLVSTIDSLDKDDPIQYLQRIDLKSRFNEWLGAEQNHNDFIRVAVIAQTNKKIIDLINKYRDVLLFSVTDSLGSLIRLPELDNNKDWSIKGEGYLYIDGNNRLYLDDNGYILDSTIRGIPSVHVKGMHIEEYKQLTEKFNKNKNLFKLDFNKKEIIRNV